MDARERIPNRSEIHAACHLSLPLSVPLSVLPSLPLSHPSLQESRYYPLFLKTPFYKRFMQIKVLENLEQMPKYYEHIQVCLQMMLCDKM